jgi:hypothetical protein
MRMRKKKKRRRRKERLQQLVARTKTMQARRKPKMRRMTWAMMMTRTTPICPRAPSSARKSQQRASPLAQACPQRFASPAGRTWHPHAPWFAGCCLYVLMYPCVSDRAQEELFAGLNCQPGFICTRTELSQDLRSLLQTGLFANVDARVVHRGKGKHALEFTFSENFWQPIKSFKVSCASARSCITLFCHGRQHLVLTGALATVGTPFVGAAALMGMRGCVAGGTRGEKQEGQPAGSSG